MALESAAERRKKRVVEIILSGFLSADKAIIFGNTCEQIINETTTEIIKFKQSIGAIDTMLAITKDYNGPTAVKMLFLGISDHNTAIAICEKVRKIAILHKEAYNQSLEILNEKIMEKPQPQFLTR